jgi:hypothetical protein
MVFLCVLMFRSILGTVVEDKQESTKDSLERKQDMGVCRRESGIVARTKNRFLSTVYRYMNRNSPKRMGCNLGSLENTRSRNLEICVLFSGSTWLMCL